MAHRNHVGCDVSVYMFDMWTILVFATNTQVAFSNCQLFAEYRYYGIWVKFDRGECIWIFQWGNIYKTSSYDSKLQFYDYYELSVLH